MSKSNSQRTDILVNLPFYDFRKADDEYGIYELVSENGFEEFIKEKYLVELTEMRQNFMRHDYEETKRRAHKIKSAFCYLFLYFCVNSASKLMNSKDMETGKDYVDFVVKMRIFFEELKKFAEKSSKVLDLILENPISQAQINSFYEITHELDAMETKAILIDLANHEKCKIYFLFLDLKNALAKGTYEEVIKLPDKNNLISTPQSTANSNPNLRTKTNTTMETNFMFNDGNSKPSGSQCSPLIKYGKNKSHEKHPSARVEDSKSQSIKKRKSLEDDILIEGKEKKICCKVNSCPIF